MSKIIVANWNLPGDQGGAYVFHKTLSKILDAKLVSYEIAEGVINYNLFPYGEFHPLYRGYIIEKYLEWYENLFIPDLIIKNAGVGGFMKLKTPQILVFQNAYLSCLKKFIEKRMFFGKSSHLECMELERLTAQQSLKNVAVSNFMKEEMKLRDIRCDKVIEEGIDVNVFKPIDNKEQLKKIHGLPLDKKIGIAVTSFSVTKGWDILVELINKFPDVHWIVVLTGEVGVKPKLKNVTLVEKVPHEMMSKYYNCADFYISTSPTESFNLSACEASSCDLPIITYKTGWAWDFWNKRLGYRVDDWDVESFEKAVEKIRDSDLKEFSPRKALIEKRFTKEVMEKNWKEFVEKTLNKTKTKE